MAKDTVSLALRGEIPLDKFAEAIVHFSKMVNALTIEIAGPVDIEWEVTHLESGSAIAKIRGISTDVKMVEKVVRAYSVIGQALERNEPIPFSEAVSSEARMVTSVLNGKITGIEFRTDDQQFTINTRIADLPEERSGRYTLGTVTGKLETLTSRRGLKFIIYDLFDKATTCHPSADQIESVKNYWGKRVTVAGEIRRDPETGHPLDVRNIRYVQAVESLPNSHLRARGAIPWKEGDPLPEQRIRRMRDDT